MDKQCNKCSQVLPEADFSRDGMRNGAQQYKSSCKRCEAVRMSAYLSDPGNRERQRTIVLRSKRKRVSQDPEGHKAYRRAHAAMRRYLGAANGFPCVECEKQAEEWSMNQDAKDVVHSQRYSWSMSVTDYAPRCVPCHRALDSEARHKRVA